ncbi:hypothetical protein SCP_0804520 [Sparassis crispa]|uniref:Uncharacterized protein n=1 Tax=Sparassis crispa TaxID=139825 RepID=A0A401GUN1_9APHY|nr:hypothetical protein SCP_0804520 [Sparassis crispa]GBE85928.1 hypothetical protein SCP_0804520 [Sparassis crispa]
MNTSNIPLGSANAVQFVEVSGREADVMPTKSREALEKRVLSSPADIRLASNCHASINCLPSEVLAMILQFVLEPRYSQKEYRRRINHRSLPPWQTSVQFLEDISVTHVCRQWRSLAEELPLFWTHVTDSPSTETATRAFIQRSRLAPLRIYIRPSPSAFLKSFAGSNGHRLSTLWWEGGRGRNYVGSSLLSASAPELVSLTLHASSSLPNAGGLTVGPSLLFRGNVPRLRQLSIHGFSWLPTNQFDSLAQLHLSDLRYSGLFGDFLSLLTHVPNLVDLVLIDLDDSSGRFETAYRTKSPQIMLKHLRTFLFSAVASTGPLISHITTGTNTALWIRDYRIGNRNLSAYEFAGLPAMTNVTKLTIMQDPPRTAFMCVGPSSGVCIDYHLDWSSDSKGLRSVVVAELSCPNIEELWVIERNQGWFYPAFFHSCEMLVLLRALTSLNKIVILEESLESLCTALRHAATDLSPEWKLATLHVILHGGRGHASMALIVSCAPVLRWLGVENLVVGFLPDYDGPGTVPEDVLRAFNSVKCIRHTKMPTMDIPVTCKTSPHLLWPSWVDTLSKLPC